MQLDPQMVDALAEASGVDPVTVMKVFIGYDVDSSEAKRVRAANDLIEGSMGADARRDVELTAA